VLQGWTLQEWTNQHDVARVDIAGVDSAASILISLTLLAVNCFYRATHVVLAQYSAIVSCPSSICRSVCPSLGGGARISEQVGPAGGPKVV